MVPARWSTAHHRVFDSDDERLAVPQTAWVLTLTLALALALACGSTAHAQLPPAFVVRAEFGGAAMLPEYQRQALDESLGVYLAVRAGARVLDPLTFQLGWDTYILPTAVGLAQQHDFTGGFRVEPRLSFGRLFFDVNAGVGLTGGRVRLQIDGGVGLDIRVLAWLRVGPFVRYGHLFATDEDHPSDAQFLTVGANIAVGAREPAKASTRSPRPSTGDADSDGVRDDRDLCVHESAGSTRDPEREGCPLRDRDGDGISDTNDLCLGTPAGPRPSAQRAGCPVEDTDSDGVSDADDACATVPVGDYPDPRRRGCPEADQDGDHVRDSHDACPTQRPGLIPDAARPGCPLPDADGDSVPDVSDACPSEPGAPSTTPARHGCAGLGRIEGGRLTIQQPIFFAPNSDRILPRSRAILSALAEMLVATPQIRRIAIEGHTDDLGEAEQNLEISRRRAHSVMAWLIREGRIDVSRLEADGFGESRPLVPSTVQEARTTNRRVEFRIVDPPPDRSDQTAPEAP